MIMYHVTLFNLFIPISEGLRLMEIIKFSQRTDALEKCSVKPINFWVAYTIQYMYVKVMSNKISKKCALKSEITIFSKEITTVLDHTDAGQYFIYQHIISIQCILTVYGFTYSSTVNPRYSRGLRSKTPRE